MNAAATIAPTLALRTGTSTIPESDASHGVSALAKSSNILKARKYQAKALDTRTTVAVAALRSSPNVGSFGLYCIWVYNIRKDYFKSSVFWISIHILC